MNNEEIEHIRDRYMCAILTGLISNPLTPPNDELYIARVSNSIVSEIMKNRKRYYEAKDKLNEA